MLECFMVETPNFALVCIRNFGLRNRNTVCRTWGLDAITSSHNNLRVNIGSPRLQVRTDSDKVRTRSFGQLEIALGSQVTRSLFTAMLCQNLWSWHLARHLPFCFSPVLLQSFLLWLVVFLESLFCPNGFWRLSIKFWCTYVVMHFS